MPLFFLMSIRLFKQPSDRGFMVEISTSRTIRVHERSDSKDAFRSPKPHFFLDNMTFFRPNIAAIAAKSTHTPTAYTAILLFTVCTSAIVVSS